MAFDPKEHTIDPSTGFMVGKDTGHLSGIMSPPPVNPGVAIPYPKWVKPHANHVIRKQSAGAPDHVSTPEFPDFHVNRGDGAVTVLVKNAAEEAKALADPLAKPAEQGV